MKKKYLILMLMYIMSINMIFLSACGKNDDNTTDKEKNILEKTENTNFSFEYDEIFALANSEINDNVADIYFASENMIDNIEVGSNGDLYFLSSEEPDESLSWKTKFNTLHNGEVVSSQTDDYFRCLCLDEKSETFYTYNLFKSRLEARNLEFEYIKTLVDDFSPFEVKDMILRDSSLYVLTVTQNPYEMQDDFYVEESDGYVDYGEKLLKVSLEDGKCNEVGISNIITMCASDNQYIYLYTHREDSYKLEVYDTVSEKIVASMNIEDLGYVFAFAVLDSKLFYISADSTGLCVYDIPSGERRCLVPEASVSSQSDFDTCGRYLVLLNGYTREICTIDSISGKINSGYALAMDDGQEAEVLVGAVGLWDIEGSLGVSLKDFSETLGIKINTMLSPVDMDASFNETLLLKLMAGDPEVDIFVLSTTEPYSRKISNDGVCYPLNSSEIIAADNKAFFENISKRFQTPNGNIWGIPLRSYMEVMVASPKNLEKKGISTDIFKDYKTFIDAMKKLDNREGIFVSGYDYGLAVMSNYITNGHTDFVSESFRDFFKNVWGGWKLYEDLGRANNPYFGKVIDTGLSFYENKALIDPDTTLLHMVDANELFSNEGWNDEFGIYGIPVLGQDDKQCISLHKVAVINPNSKNIDNALKVLEAISEHLRDNGSLRVVYKDRSRYSGAIDIDSKLFNSLYYMSKDALVTVHGITNDVILNEVEAYQNGDIDLDTAIKSIQRKEDVYLNE